MATGSSLFAVQVSRLKGKKILQFVPNLLLLSIDVDVCSLCRMWLILGISLLFTPLLGVRTNQFMFQWNLQFIIGLKTILCSFLSITFIMFFLASVASIFVHFSHILCALWSLTFTILISFCQILTNFHVQWKPFSINLWLLLSELSVMLKFCSK